METVSIAAQKSARNVTLLLLTIIIAVRSAQINHSKRKGGGRMNLTDRALERAIKAMNREINDRACELSSWQDSREELRALQKCCPICRDPKCTSDHK